MTAMHRPAICAALALGLSVGSELAGWGTSAAVVLADPEQTVVAATAGTIGASNGASESVTFSGPASITGKVIYDPDFGAPPVLQIIVDLSRVTGKGLQTGKAYLVSGQAILHRPLVAFDSIRVGFAFGAGGNMAGSALASFDLSYSAATGMTTSPVRIATQPPGI